MKNRFRIRYDKIKKLHYNIKQLRRSGTVLKMMEEERDCSDIITQLTAVRSSVDHVLWTGGNGGAVSLSDLTEGSSSTGKIGRQLNAD